MSKTSLDYIWFAAAFALIIACNSKKSADSVTSADTQNDSMASVNNDSELKDDYDFAVEAADGNLLEVQSATLATERASSRNVSDIARMMSKDHGAANQDLKRLTHQKNVVLPTALSSKSQKSYDNLKSKQGDAFERAYLEMILVESGTGLDAYKKEAENGKDVDFRGYAKQRANTMRHHVEMSKAAKKSL